MLFRIVNNPRLFRHMMLVVLILQKLINNQDNFEQHLSFTIREVPAVALGILERRLTVQGIFQIQMA